MPGSPKNEKRPADAIGAPVVTAHLHVALAHFSRHNAQSVRFWAFDPKEIIGQSRAELPVDPKDELG